MFCLSTVKTRTLFLLPEVVQTLSCLSATVDQAELFCAISYFSHCFDLPIHYWTSRTVEFYLLFQSLFCLVCPLLNKQICCVLSGDSVVTLSVYPLSNKQNCCVPSAISAIVLSVCPLSSEQNCCVISAIWVIVLSCIFTVVPTK